MLAQRGWCQRLASSMCFEQTVRHPTGDVIWVLVMVVSFFRTPWHSRLHLAEQMCLQRQQRGVSKAPYRSSIVCTSPIIYRPATLPLRPWLIRPCPSPQFLEPLSFLRTNITSERHHRILRQVVQVCLESVHKCVGVIIPKVPRLALGRRPDI